MVICNKKQYHNLCEISILRLWDK